MEILPLWTSHYSGRSILTLEKSNPKVGPKSIISLCKENGIKDLYLIESNMTGFLEAYTNSQDAGLNLRFGLKLIITDDSSKKEDSIINESKIIFFIKNSKGYEDLIKIWAWANENGFYYQPRVDWKNFNDLVTENIGIAFPFYDSFVATNIMTFSEIVPSINEHDCCFFIEENDMPFDTIIKEAVENYSSSNQKCELVKAQSIFYEKKSDFKAYQTFRCILKKTKLSNPNLDYMSSDSFCLESWIEKCQKK